MKENDKSIFNLLFIKRPGFTNTLVQNLALRISSVEIVSKCLSKLYIFVQEKIV